VPATVRASRTGNGTSHSLRLHSSCRHIVGSKPTTDFYFVQQAIAGDPNAQEQLFKVYSPTLYRRAFAILRNKEDAQDALQDGWFRAYSNLRSFEGRSSFSTWLTQIVINSALMILRRNRNRRELSTDEAGEVSFIHEIADRSLNPEQAFLRSEQKAILADTIGDLRPRIRVMVELGPLQERSANEAARRLGISPQAAKARLFHARTALRKSAVLRAVA
jgi:RNA polymerase sigma-70 factor (ECF subfamily)